MSCTQVYTGDGKGKTTAALGLLVRAVGAGLRVRVFQFLKRGEYSELHTLASRFPEIEVTQCGSGSFIRDLSNIPQEDRDLAMEGFAQARQAVMGGQYGLVILDEANTAMAMGLIPVEDMLALMRQKPASTELVLTGRDAPPAILEAADLCTEMRKIKHYYDNGIPARKGIEL